MGGEGIQSHNAAEPGTRSTLIIPHFIGTHSPLEECPDINRWPTIENTPDSLLSLVTGFVVKLSVLVTPFAFYINLQWDEANLAVLSFKFSGCTIGFFTTCLLNYCFLSDPSFQVVQGARAEELLVQRSHLSPKQQLNCGQPCCRINGHLFHPTCTDDHFVPQFPITVQYVFIILLL